MRTRRSDSFTTITVAGQVLPADLLQRIADKDKELGGLGADSYHLSPSETISEATSRAWNKLVAAWGNFKSARNKLSPNDPGTTVTRERWLLPLFQELGYGRLPASRSAVEIDGKGYAISHWWSRVPIHLVGVGVSIDKLSARIPGAARSSPHSLVQELLNRSEESLWGFVSNGSQLRILRDNQNLIRQAYVEFDLETMMEGEAYSDFVMLWLLCHQSRVEAEKPSDYWLEKWSRAAQERGVRALEHLREGVEEAISLLGSGFLAHRGNGNLKEKLRSGLLNKQDYYRQLLRVVYRLLFLFVAEDRTDEKNRSLLFDPAATAEACERYSNFYSTRKLRRLAERRHGSRHSDLYAGLRLVMQKLGSDSGCADLGLPALGSFLFSEDAIADLSYCDIANHDLLDAVRALAFATDNQARRQIDYKNLGSEELGSVYESLLQLRPEVNADAAIFDLRSTQGSERKTTGSYYTPSSLVNCLLDSALDPLLDEASKKPNAEEVILDLKVCDPACGSGHFLVAAAHRLAYRLASVRTGDAEPSPGDVRHALRQVIGRCIYGVDMNPMAVELCKVSLWMEALEPGRPLSFLDHHIQYGNSLIGATPSLLENGIPDGAFKVIEGDDKKLCAEYKKQNARERKQETLKGLSGEPWEQLGNFARGMMRLDSIGDDTIEGVREKQEHYQKLVTSNDYIYGGLLADAWCAAFVWKKQRSQELPYAITEEEFRKIERNPFSAPPWMKKEIRRLADQFGFFHWQLAFPTVFRLPLGEEEPDNLLCGWSGGFDLVIGNPPWERVKLQEREWFAALHPDIANASTAAIRQRLIAHLATENPSAYSLYEEALRKAEGESSFARNSGRFPYSSAGDTNTYPLFTETGENIVRGEGRVGIIVKTGILADYSLRDFFNHLVETGKLVSAYDFSNRRLIFPAVVANERFTLLTLGGPTVNARTIRVSILNEDVADLASPGRVWQLSREDIARINPNTLTCPLFQTTNDALIVTSIYRRLPILLQENIGEPTNTWGIDYVRMFDMTNDSGLFKDQEMLEAASLDPASPIWDTDEGQFVALLEGKLYDLFDHRHGTFAGVPRGSRFGIKAEPNHLTLVEKQDPCFECLPRYWVPSIEARTRYAERLGFPPNGVLTFRDVCRTHTDLRTVRACICPAWAAGNKAPLLLFPSQTPQEYALRCLLLCGNLASFVLDYVARQKFSGGSLNKFIIVQFPVLPRPAYDQRCAWSASERSLSDWVLPRLLELIYTTWSLEAFAQDCGYSGPPFRWDEGRRSLLRCELDAAFLHLYLGDQAEWSEQPGLIARQFPTPRDAADYILDTFPIMKRKEEEKYGEYRTKRIILEIYGEMVQAMATGHPYQTRLNPPPADVRVAHPPRILPVPLVLPSTVRYPQPDAGVYMMRVILTMLQEGGGTIDVERLMNGCSLLAMPDTLETYGARIEPDLAHEWRTRFSDQFRPELFLAKLDDLVQRGEIKLVREDAGFKAIRVSTADLVTDLDIEFDARFALRIGDSLGQAERDAFSPMATREEIESRSSEAA